MPLHVLAIGAHPDDVELTCGGTVARLVDAGHRVGMVALTAGELGTRGDVDTRRSEFEEAGRILGVELTRILGLPDGGLVGDDRQKSEVIRLIRELRPSLVFAPYWKDRHPDHANASRLIIESAFHSGLRKIDTGLEAFRPYRVLFYPSRQDFRPSFIVDVSATHDRKMEAIRAYKSQFGQEGKTEPETNISHPGFLEAIAARGRLYGSYIGTAYGEAFLVREPIRIDDPVTLFGPESLMSFV